MTVTAIVQARMSSSRLPGKVLMDLEGLPMIARQLERVSKSKNIDELIVATSIEKSDDVLANYINSIGVAVHRGSLDDVLLRFVETLEKTKAHACVRLTADCPLAEFDVIDSATEMFLESDFDYVSNSLNRTYPRGLDVEVVKVSALKELARNDFDPLSREHVTFGIYKNPGQYSLGSLEQQPSQAHLRWTVDTQADLDFVRLVYRNLYTPGQHFSQSAILEWLAENPKYQHFEEVN